MKTSSKKTTIRRTERKTPKYVLASFCAQWIQKRGPKPLQKLRGAANLQSKISIPAAETKLGCVLSYLENAIIHQTHYEKFDWSRAFSQFTIACERDMINAISAADIAFIMSSWSWNVLRNKMAERFASVSEDELCEKCIIKELLNSVFA